MPSSPRRHLTSLVTSKLARASLWLFVGGIAGGILGYVFQVLRGRMLSTREYGLFSAMMALFTVFGAPPVIPVTTGIQEHKTQSDLDPGPG